MFERLVEVVAKRGQTLKFVSATPIDTLNTCRDREPELMKSSQQLDTTQTKRTLTTLRPPYSLVPSFFLVLAFLFVSAALAPAFATDSKNDESAASNAKIPQRLLHILDYVSVEYGNIVQNGKILDQGEYQEQIEFSHQLNVYLQQLANSPERKTLQKDALALQQLIKEKDDAKKLKDLSSNMSRFIIEKYQVVVTPRHLPSLDGAASMFQQHCSACHGEKGFGNGIQAAGLEPAPANFHEQDRQQHRNIYSLYNTISMGVNGTAMRSFSAELSEAQRWSLAFYVSNFYASEQQSAAAATMQGKTPHDIINLQQLTQLTPAAAKAEFGDKGVTELLYLRAHPSALKSLMKDPFAIIDDNLQASVDAHQAGRLKQSYDFAVAAYLEGFELLEPKLKTIDAGLLKQVENAMMHFREISRDKSTSLVALKTSQNEIEKLTAEVKEKIQNSSLSHTVNFVSSFLIVLREGVEAILVLAAIFAVLVKTGRRETFKYLHMGWIAAIALGVVTWFAAANLISISGASREVSEGLIALIAAAMLVYVGYWLHRQSSAAQWQRFISEKINQSLSNKAITGLTLIAFLAVYREVFETILFINTLWIEADSSSQSRIIFGAISAVALLTLIAWGIFKFSLRLPLKLFFRINAVFLYALAVVFAGKGIAALQEAGKLPIDSVPFIEIDALGIYPNIESLSVQAFLILLAVIFYLGSQVKRDSGVENFKNNGAN